MSESLRRRLRAAWARPEGLFVTPEGGEFEAWCREHPGSAVELRLSARCLHELVVDPALPMADLAAVRAYAEQQFAHYFGTVAQRFAIAPWQAGGRSGASALQGLDLAALQSQAQSAGVRLAAVRPAWSAWLASLPASVRAGSGLLLWLEPGLRVEIQLEQGRVVAVQPRRVDDDTELPTALAVGRPQEALTPQPGPAQPAPDFIGRPARSRLAWPLAATGLLVLATAAWSTLQSYQTLQAAQAAQALASARRPATAARSAAAPTTSPSRSALEARLLLATPWEALLSRVEQGGAEAEGVAWLGLDASPARGELKLGGLTQDKQVALRLADRLSATPDWGQVVLSRFAQAEPGLAGQRFEISAKRVGGRP